MSKYLAFYRNAVRAALNDNDEEDLLWSDDELEQHILHAVRDISMLSPAEKKVALGMTASSKIVDISSLDDLIHVDRVEYKPEQTPPTFRNFTEVWDNKLTIDTGLTPAATATGTLTGTVTFTRGSTAISAAGGAFSSELATGNFIKKSDGVQYYRVSSITDDDNLVLEWASQDTGADTVSTTIYSTGDPVYIYYAAMHDLDSDSSTIPDRLSQTVIDGAVAYTARAFCAGGMEKIQDAVDKFTDVETAITATTARIAQAVLDIDAGRTVLAASIASADDEIEFATTGATAPLTLAATAIGEANTAISAGESIANINAIIDTAGTNIALAITDIGTARDSWVGSESTAAGAAIDKMLTEIDLAIGDLVTGRTFINTVNKGANVPGEYANSARAELSTALGWLNQAKGFLMEDTPHDRYIRQAQAEINAGIANLQQARTFLALDQPVGEKLQVATTHMNSANARFQMARTFMAEAQAASLEYTRLASAELSTSNIYFNKAKTYMAEVNAKLSVVSSYNSFQSWANAQYAMYQEALKTKTQRKMRVRYTYPS